MYLHANPPQGHGEWEDGTQVRLRVMWRTPKEWASYIYAYVGMLRIVFCVPPYVLQMQLFSFC